MVKAPDLMEQMRVMSYRSITEVGDFETFLFSGRISICPFHIRLLTAHAKTAKNIFFQF